MERLRRVRCLAAAVLLAALGIIAVMPHRHALADEGSGEKASTLALTTHNPLSRAVHWHAVIKIVPRDACWACHWNRLFGLLPAASLSLPLAPGQRMALLPPRSARTVARFTRRSRAPPSLG